MASFGRVTSPPRQKNLTGWLSAGEEAVRVAPGGPFEVDQPVFTPVRMHHVALNCFLGGFLKCPVAKGGNGSALAGHVPGLGGYISLTHGWQEVTAPSALWLLEQGGREGGRAGLALLPGSCQRSSRSRLLSGSMAGLLAPGGRGLLRASRLAIPALRSCCSQTHPAPHRGIACRTPGDSCLHGPLGRRLPCPRWASGSAFNVPPSAEDTARTVGIGSMFKLPMQDSAEGLDVAFVGVPLDIGTSNRPGARFGPLHLRAESVMVRHFNPATGADPYHSLQVADIGDVGINLYDLKDSCRRIREAYRRIVAGGCIPLTLGGDHTITYPILQALAEKHGPVALVHVDAHTDTADQALGERIYHGTPFRRCVEEGLLDCRRVVQIGIRGSSYSPDPYRFSWDQGFRVVLAEDCWMKSLAPLMAEVRAQVGDRPLYLSFDIDALDPAFAPGTGTPETAGLTPAQALEIIRGCQGLRVVGGDLVEVAPVYDLSGTTALLGANLLFEMLCALPGVKRSPPSQKSDSTL